MICLVCGRPLGSTGISKHHIVPKSRGGKEVIELHNICHEKLHRTFTNKELESIIFTAVLEHEEIQKFIKWVAKKPIDYYSGSDESNVRYNKRRR